jgi:hypothetical protein
MKALISPNDSTPQYISSWQQGETVNNVVIYTKVFSDIPNAQRVAQVEDATFEVADPLFWVDCNSSVIADQWYYDTSDSTIKEIEPLNASNPALAE